jgi:hypothetical protein
VKSQSIIKLVTVPLELRQLPISENGLKECGINLNFIIYLNTNLEFRLKYILSISALNQNNLPSDVLIAKMIATHFGVHLIKTSWNPLSELSLSMTKCVVIVNLI